MFVNLTNHPVSKWSKEQKEAAQNMPLREDDDKDRSIMCFAYLMPNVDPSFTRMQVRQLARNTLNTILDQIYPQPKINKEFGRSHLQYLVQGHFGLVHNLVEMISDQGETAFYATSERKSSEVVKEDGTTEKVSTFSFVQFTEY